MLIKAIAIVETDDGRTSKNVYQIRDIYIKDLNRIYTYKYHIRDKYSRSISEMMMYDYWRYYGYQYVKDTGNPITYEVLARIHNGGPDGWKEESTKKYWHKVERHLQSLMK
jgi:hypothetical protein